MTGRSRNDAEKIGCRQSGLHPMDFVEGIEPQGVLELIEGSFVSTEEHADPATLDPS